MVQRQRVKAVRQPCQFMIMRCEQASAAVGFVNALHHGPSNGKAIIGRCAAPNLIQYNKAAFGRLGENGGGFDHFDHEG